MQLQPNAKMAMVTVIFMLHLSTGITAQIPPADIYNTSNYPEDRKAIEALGILADSTACLNDDYISVGAEGMVY